MSSSILDGSAAIVRSALAIYEDDSAAVEVLQTCEQRLREPLRLALAGMIKAGKSTLLNAMIGEQIAPTDAGECTRAVTWYRYADTPRVTVHPRDGEPLRRPVRRDSGRLVLDMGGLTAEEVSWIEVEWPSISLRSTILIDTPGIASISAATSARSATFLTPQSAPSAADAIIYLLRHVHASDVSFLEAFRDTTPGPSQTVNALAVLSRADEVGSGRVDSLLSARAIAERYRVDGELRSLALDVIPVAGLLAESARTLRESEFAAFRHLASLDRGIRERLLISVDRFTRPSEETTLTVEQRRHLIERFGIYGVRLGALLVRGGAETASGLSERMVLQSGLLQVQQFVQTQFRSRSEALKVRGVLQSVESLMREKPRAGTAPLIAGIERVTASAHSLRELSLLSRARTDTLPLPADDAVEAERIIGGEGTPWRTRLGLPPMAEPEIGAARVDELLRHWHRLAQSPLSPRATVAVCREVIRSIEEIESELRAGGGSDGPTADIDARTAPPQDGGQEAQEQSEHSEAEHDKQHLP